MVTLPKYGFPGGDAFQSTEAETVRSPALPDPPKALICWQTALPFAFTPVIACPEGQVPFTLSCLLLTAAAVALKFAFISEAFAGVPCTKVFGTVKSAASDGSANSDSEVRLRAALRSVCIVPPS